jgi:hypothetical protein
MPILMALGISKTALLLVAVEPIVLARHQPPIPTTSSKMAVVAPS